MSVDLPAPGAPVMPRTCARPTCGATASAMAPASGAPCSIALIARAIARRSPARIARRPRRRVARVHRQRARHTAACTWPKPISRRSVPQISPCVQPASAAATTCANTLSLRIVGGAGERVPRRATAASSAPPCTRGTRRRGRASSARRASAATAARCGPRRPVRVDADDGLLARLDVVLEAARRFADLPLHDAGGDGGVHSARVLDDRASSAGSPPPSRRSASRRSSCRRAGRSRRSGALPRAGCSAWRPRCARRTRSGRTAPRRRHRCAAIAGRRGCRPSPAR